MGWTSYSMHTNIKDWFKSTWDSDKYIVLDSALVNRTVLYGAVKKIETGQVFCAIFLIRWSKGQYNFSYKDMTEFEGVYEINCPKKIFSLLTPLDQNDKYNEYAINWRNKVIAYHSTNDKLKAKNIVIKTSIPIVFNSGINFQYFRKEGKSWFAGALQINNVFTKVCKIRGFNINNYEFEFIECKGSQIL
jgi:hypothetical protein